MRLATANFFCDANNEGTSLFLHHTHAIICSHLSIGWGGGGEKRSNIFSICMLSIIGDVIEVIVNESGSYIHIHYMGVWILFNDD